MRFFPLIDGPAANGRGSTNKDIHLNKRRGIPRRTLDGAVMSKPR